MSEASAKLKLARIAARVEGLFDKVMWRTPSKPGAIDPYVGYVTPHDIVIRGRVLGQVRPSKVDIRQSRWRNFRQMLRLFATDEVANVTVQSQGVSGVTDDEGYFTLHLPRDMVISSVAVQADGLTAHCPVAWPRDDAAFGVISDIDDTMVRTDAFSLWRNVWTSLTGNSLTREVFADAVELMQVLYRDGQNPVFFVSSSPWNFHGFLQDIFERANLPKAPMFLRDYGISETQFITGTHGDHKGSAIDVVLAANPDLPFILVGDTGQHDAEVYAAAAARHPGRIKHVVLRVAGPDAGDPVAIARLEALGVPHTVAPDYRDAIAILGGGA